MKTAILLIANLFCSSLFCFAQKTDSFSLGPDKQIKLAQFQAWKSDSVKAVLVITPSFGENPNNNDRVEIKEWKEYAHDHNMGLIFVDFTANSIPPQAKGDVLNAIEGTSEIVKQGVNQEFKTDVPIFLYGRNDQSTQYLLSMIDSNPDSFMGWCSNGPEFLKNLPSLTKATPPGIVVCTTDSIRYDDALKFFISGRKTKSNWTWLGYRSIDSPKIRDFVRQYFLALLDSPPGQWRNNNTGQPVSADVANNDLENTTWVPNPSIGDSWATLQVSNPKKPIIIEKEVDLSGHGLPNIQLYLRIPNGAQDASGVNGVLAYCTWTRERDTLIQQLSNDTEQPAEKIELPSVQMLRFAAKHNLAVLTWSTPGKWNVDENGDQLSEKDKLDVDRQFDLFAAAWEQGVSQLCDQYKLPQDKYLLFGMSRGAQWAHRLALRNPSRFWAINVHVSSSYDEPTEAGKKCLWLVTSGELDKGLEDSKRFYASCEKLGYPILFKAPNGLGHEMRSDVDAIRDAFFEYALSIENQTQNADSDISDLISLKNAKYVGDYVSQKVVTVDHADEIKTENQVYLPTDALADAWRTPSSLDSSSPPSVSSSSTNTLVNPPPPSSSNSVNAPALPSPTPDK